MSDLDVARSCKKFEGYHLKKERRYVLILDKHLDYIRVFRADCPVRAEGKTLWEGDGLHRAYEAMKRLNRDRKPIKTYFVCTKLRKDTKTAVRVFMDPKDEWKKESRHAQFIDAAAAARALRKTIDEKIMRQLCAVGIVRTRLPKLTRKDLMYLEWHERKREAEKAA